MSGQKLSRRWIIAGGVVAITAAGAGAWSLRNMAVSACRNPQRVKDLDMAKANGCGEFWLNRYQTTIQTVVSFFVGGLGIYFVIRQLKELGQQNYLTRQALEANTKEQASNRRARLASAELALDRGTAIVERLTEESIRAQVVHRPISDKERAEFEAFRLLVTEIYPALETADLVSDWDTIFSEFEQVSAYIIARRRGFSIEESIQVLPWEPLGPTDDEDATNRASSLASRVSSLRAAVAALISR